MSEDRMPPLAAEKLDEERGRRPRPSRPRAGHPFRPFSAPARPEVMLRAAALGDSALPERAAEEARRARHPHRRAHLDAAVRMAPYARFALEAGLDGGLPATLAEGRRPERLEEAEAVSRFLDGAPPTPR